MKKLYYKTGSMKELESQSAKKVYISAIKSIKDKNIDFLVGGGFALRYHTGIIRDTKDLDLFTTPSNYPKILKALAQEGFHTELTDARWVAKAIKQEHFIDILFNTANSLCNVDESFFRSAPEGNLFGEQVKFLSAEDLFFCKIYVQNRDHYDGADLNHLILKKGKEMDWKKILDRLDNHWQLLFGQIINFLFVYPTERDAVPKWLTETLSSRLHELYEFPVGKEKVCRGPLIEHSHYNNDVLDWGYKVMSLKKL